MEQILNNKQFISKLKAIAKKQGSDFDEIKNESNTYLKELHSIHNPVVNAFSVELAQYILGRAYEKTIDVDHGQLKSLAKLMRRHSIAFVMTHKTYIDMFVLGVVLARHGLPLPYIFSGINMSFMGLGELGRKTGAIFIRREIKNNEVYKLTLRQYIAYLVDQRSHFMWAIEGTRSRTGKLVWPKMGILKYILEGESVSSQEVKYVPISIVYDLIPDVQEMIKESRGKVKNQESLIWFMNYVRKMGDDFGKISLRVGEPINIDDDPISEIPQDSTKHALKPTISRFAFELVHNINQITPVTSVSLICTALLSKFALKRNALESLVIDLMALIEGHKSDALVDRGKPIGQSIQSSINLLIKSGLLRQLGEGRQAKYSIVPENYLTANYYSNMAVHQLYHRAFVELAIMKVAEHKTENRMFDFWNEVMELRSLFKFEFFYSNKSNFSDEVETDLYLLNKDWKSYLINNKKKLLGLIQDQRMLIAPVVLSTYLEAYQVVAATLINYQDYSKISKEEILNACIFQGEEMHWTGKIHRVESVSKPFLLNGIRLAENLNLIPTQKNTKTNLLEEWKDKLVALSRRIQSLQNLSNFEDAPANQLVPLEKKVVPGSKTASVIEDVLNGEKGAHIAAYFDLDRTLISEFSAKEFFQTRLMSGKMTPKEIAAQFNGMLVYATGNRNFAGLAAIGAKGVKGIKESVFIKVGEKAYLKNLSKSIYPESRALVDAHMAMGHTVAIVSAATPYQVMPIARDLGIEDVMCTKLEVVNGKFTGEIVAPACWGEGKAIAGRAFAKQKNIDLDKSYFYTDSNEDFALLDIVGNPVPVNPDSELSTLAFANDWPIYRFNDGGRPGIQNFLRSFLGFGSMIPAALTGMLSGMMTMSWRDGVNSMMAVVGDLGCKLSGIHLVVKGEENLWKNRPAVFIFNHQSNADLLIISKLLRKDTVAIAKQELKYTPLGPLFAAAGIIFIDRSNREKAIEAFKPAVEALQGETSVAIAPEGTRSFDYNLGQFKKGAFHLAMQAGVPIVPIVVKNAHDAMPRGSGMMTPTVVEVVVLKPVSTKKWVKADLNSHISQIRNRYLAELGQVKMDPEFVKSSASQ